MNKLKYEYGVAYETNGEKPELPDDVLVHVMADGEWNDYGDKCNAVENWNWSLAGIKKFRIMDERYKPKPDEPNWHERGELPPVGEICNYKTSSGKSAKVEITAHSRMGICFCEVGRDGESYVSKGQILNFVPLPTDRDVLVEKAADAMRGTELNLTGSHLQVLSRKLIDAGWRPVKQQTEDEFVNYGINCFTYAAMSTSRWAELYRSGCRFIEVGDD